MAIMDRIISEVSQRAGIPEEKARTAVSTTIDKLDSELPEPVGGRIGPMVRGEQGGTSGLKDAAGGMGDMLGG